MTQPHILLQLYHSVVDDIRFHQEQINRLEQRSYTIQQEITNALNRERDTLPFRLRPRSSLSTQTPPRRRHPTSTSSTSSLSSPRRDESPTRVSIPEEPIGSFAPLPTNSTSSSSALSSFDNYAFNYVGTYDLPLTTSFARSILNRSSLQSNPTASESSTSSMDPSSMLLYFMLDTIHNDSIRDEQHGIEDPSRYLKDMIYGEVEHPPNTCCPIQMDIFNENTEVSQINKCKHLFCRQEIRRWLETHNTCPLCRTSIDE